MNFGVYSIHKFFITVLLINAGNKVRKILSERQKLRKNRQITILNVTTRSQRRFGNNARCTKCNIIHNLCCCEGCPDTSKSDETLRNLALGALAVCVFTLCSQIFLRHF